MIKHILKQIWNKRRANAWIFLELILVTFFMWGAIDSIYLLLSNRAIAPGYHIDQVFRVMIGEYPSTHRKYNEAFNSDLIRRANVLQLYDLIKNYPNVESAVITDGNGYPLSMSSRYEGLRCDSNRSSMLAISFYQDGDFFKVFRMQDVNTGVIPEHRNPNSRTTYLTKQLEEKLSPNKSLMNKEVFNMDGRDSIYYTVKGIMPNFKFRSTEQPTATGFIPLNTIDVDEFPWSSQICFRIRDGVSKEVFAETFKQEMTSRLKAGNLYFLKLTDFEALRRESEFIEGVTNKLRLNSVLTTFFLLCTFLGIAGTFWLRSDARREEIGLRMALGSSRKNILKEFLMEAWWIVTLAWFLGILIVLQWVYITGLGESNNLYLHNMFVPHFLIVSLIVYTLMLLITFIGTIIPAWQATLISPVDALRDE